MRGDGSEGVLDFLGGVHVLRLLADHERHVFLQRHLPVAVWIHHICEKYMVLLIFELEHNKPCSGNKLCHYPVDVEIERGKRSKLE